jgi:hypothetical protein
MGVSMNVLVLAANHTQMPVYWPGTHCTDREQMGVDLFHTCADEKVRLKILSDWIAWGDSLISPGDVLINAYEMFFTPAFAVWIALLLYERKSNRV